MAHTDYNAIVDQLAVGASANEIRWAFANFVIARLQADPDHPYVTRGSSRAGSAGSVFSATPDGVNHWIGRTQAQAATSSVWWVGENDLGHQVCLVVNPVGGGGGVTNAVIFALNKFENAGAWRGGGTSTSARPTDVTSSPTVQQELATASIQYTPQSNLNNYFNIAIRKDGCGFYAYAFNELELHASPLNDYLIGFFKMVSLHENDLNPYIACVSGGTAMINEFSQEAGQSFVGRIFDGTSVAHVALELGDNNALGWCNAIDPWENARPQHGIILRSSVTKYARGWMPDVFVGDSATSGLPDFATRGGRTYFRLKHPINIVWDGTTVRGTDIPIYTMPEYGLLGPPPPTPVPTPPIVDNIDPADGSSLGGTTAISFDVTDLSPGLNKTFVWLHLAGEDGPRLVFDGTDFHAPFDALSERSVIANGFHFSIQHDVAWPGVVEAVTVVGADSGGGLVQETFGYIAVPPPPVDLQLVRSLDARTIEIVFNQRVNQAQAEDVANYSITPTLTLSASRKMSDFHYRLTTSQQVIDETYDVSATGIGPA